MSRSALEGPRTLKSLKILVAGALVAGMAFAILPPPLLAQHPTDVVKALERFVIRVVARDGSVRSGFVIVPRGASVLAVTVLDNVKSGETLSVLDSKNMPHPGRIELWNRASGLALISIPTWTGPRVLDLDTRLLSPGDPVIVLGFDQERQELSHVRVRAQGPRQVSIPRFPQGFQGALVVNLDQRVLGMLSGPQGNVVPSTQILAAVGTMLAQASPAPGPTPGPRSGAALPPALPSPKAPDVAIQSYPTGASITIGGQPAGQAPLSLPVGRLAAGTHRISASAPGRWTMTRTITIPTEGPVDLVLPPAPAAEPSSEAARDALGRAKSALAAGDGAAALAHLRQLPAGIPLPESHIYQAAAHWLQGNRAEALSVLRAHINIYGATMRSLDAYVLMGVIFEEQRHYQGALTRYKLALKIQPQYEREIAQPSVATEAAIKALEQQVSRAPGDPTARIRLGLAYESKGRFKEGMAQFKAVLFTAPSAGAAATAVPPQSLTVFTFPAQASVAAGDRPIGRSPASLQGPPAGQIDLRVSLPGYAEMRRRINPGARSEVLFVLLPTLEGYGRTKFAIDHMRDGLRGFAAGDWVAATRAFVEALDSDSTLFRLRVYIGLGMYMQGRFSESLEFLRGHINVKNDDALAAKAYALMGVIFDEQSRYQEALTTYKLSLRLHGAIGPVKDLPPVTTDAGIAELEDQVRRTPDDPRLRFRLGVAYEAKGRFQPGMMHLRHALFSLGPP